MDAQVKSDSMTGSAKNPSAASSRYKQKGLEHLEMLLEYELRGAIRYRRFASLIFVGAGTEDTVRSVLLDHVRSSDEIFDLSPNMAILMAETDSVGAMTAINRFKSFCRSGCDLRFSVASFPADARGTAELLWTAQRRLEEAKEREPGAVVSSD